MLVATAAVRRIASIGITSVQGAQAAAEASLPAHTRPKLGKRLRPYPNRIGLHLQRHLCTLISSSKARSLDTLQQQLVSLKRTISLDRRVQDLRSGMASLSNQNEVSTRQVSPIPPPAATRRLGPSDGPLVWIDCEMTGLDFENDRILEVACIITDGQLQKVDDGVCYVVRTDKRHLDAMGDWCIKQHGESGLTAACQDKTVARDHADVRAAILAYVRDRVPLQRAACLAGNTVHADARFLSKEMPELINHLHYRIVDVSSIKELVRRWYGAEERWVGGKGSHRALDDIETSIEELKHYRQRFFHATLTQ